MFNEKNIQYEVYDHNLLEKEISESTIIYCDLDGVLADFEGEFKKLSNGISPNVYAKTNGKNSIWKLVLSQPNHGIDFWANLPKLNDADTLWNFLNSLKVSLKILSSTSSKNTKSNSADIGKRMWVAKNLNPAIKDEDIILVDSSDAKRIYAKNASHILIDDYIKNISQWRSSGGTAIHHVSTANTISQLNRILGQS